METIIGLLLLAVIILSWLAFALFLWVCNLEDNVNRRDEVTDKIISTMKTMDNNIKNQVNINAEQIKINKGVKERLDFMSR